MKNFSEFLTSKGISTEQFEAKSAEEQLALGNEHRTALQKELEQALTDKVSNEQMNAFKAELTASFDRVQKTTEALALTLKSQTEKTSNVAMTMDKAIEQVIKENADVIKENFKRGHGVLDVTKAVETIATTNAEIVGTVPDILGVNIAYPSDVNLRPATIQDLVRTIPTNQPAFAYTESLPKDGDAGFVLEKGKKPQVDLKFESRFVTPVKVAAWEHITEEAAYDIPNLIEIARNFLRAKHDLKKENGILFGTGLNGEPTGATTIARSFVAGGMAGAVTMPTIMDVINAAITDIYTTHNFQDEMPYKANIAMLNPMDFFIQFVAAKDGMGHPLYPSASLFNRVTIGGVTIIPHEEIPQGKVFVADLSKYNITNYLGYNVRIGWINEDFIHNQFVILGESRFHAFVKELDKAAFIYDDIDVIKAAIQAS